ncbi:MAG: EF-hand domain-containing protein [Roseovarius sp.]
MTTLALSIAAGAAYAAGGEKHRGGHGPKFSFEEVDVNKDGQLTQAELTAHAEARFNETDTNNDGLVSEAELRARVEAHMQERVDARVAHMMERRDANSDGQLSADEMKPRHAGKMMKRVDTDGDGSISKAEFDAMKDKRAKHRKHKDQG